MEWLRRYIANALVNGVTLSNGQVSVSVQCISTRRRQLAVTGPTVSVSVTVTGLTKAQRTLVRRVDVSHALARALVICTTLLLSPCHLHNAAAEPLSSTIVADLPLSSVPWMLPLPCAPAGRYHHPDHHIYQQLYLEWGPHVTHHGVPPLLHL
jgi:hypothetical protein